jgi:hypothetical protein
MTERHPRNAGLPPGIRMVATGRNAGKFEVRASKTIPGEYVTGKDGITRPKRRHVTVGRSHTIAGALHIQAAHREADAARKETLQLFNDQKDVV